MNRVDLIWLGQTAPPSNWSGTVHCLREPNPPRLAAAVKQVSPDAEACLFWDGSIGRPDPHKITEILGRVGDVWHAGLRLGMQGRPGLLDFVQPSWMLARDPEVTVEATSWRVSFRACLVRTEALNQLAPPSPDFETLDGAALEWGHRSLAAGALIQHVPTLIPAADAAARSLLADELLFVKRRYGMKWCFWAAMRAVLTGYARTSAVREGLRELRRRTGSTEAPPPLIKTANQNKIGHRDTSERERHETPQDNRVSVLIPTIDRYPYLRTVLRHLRDQTVPPHEVIVVDQTPADRLQEGFEQEFDSLPVRHMIRKKAGQCSSRNAGIREASGNFILFLDDDVEMPRDLLERHLKNLNEYDAQASCGHVTESKDEAPPVGFRRFRLSDVFPAGNTMTRTQALRHSGLFDLAYDHGARADKDLGMRLYLSGGRMVFDPEIFVLHHRAPRGGLRSHKARIITRATSRAQLLHRHLPSATEIYLSKRYFTARQTREMLIMRAFGTLNAAGGPLKKAAKVMLALLLLPHTFYVIRKKEREAEEMLAAYPQIPPWKPDRSPIRDAAYHSA